MKQEKTDFTEKIEVKEAASLIAKRRCFNNFVYNVNSDKPTWKNTREKLENKSLFDYFLHIKNNDTHNLCKILTSPSGPTDLFSLGLFFCLQNTLPQKNFNISFERLRNLL